MTDTYLNSVSKNIPFTQVPNSVINDERLDWGAKGVYLYLISKPSDWVFYETEIAQHSARGLGATKTAIKQLIEHGYLRRNRKRSENGKFLGWEYELVDLAEMQKTDNGKIEHRDAKNRHRFSPTSGKTDIGKMHTSNTNNTNTDINTNKDRKIIVEVRSTYDLYIKKFNRDPERYRLTDKRKAKIKARLKDAGYEMLTQAIENASNHPFYTGDNDRGWRADLDFIVRSYENVERLSQLEDQTKTVEFRL